MRRWGATSAALAALMVGSQALAAPVLSFNIPSKPLRAALIDLATTAGVSISTEAAAITASRGPAVRATAAVTRTAAASHADGDATASATPAARPARTT